MPYFIQRHKEKEDSLRDIFETYKEEPAHLIQMLEAQKLKFNKSHQKTRQVK